MIHRAGSRTPDRVLAGLAGLVTGLLGLAVASAAAALLGVRLSPAYAVAEAIVEATPGTLARAAIDLVGRWDKPLLVVGVIAGLLVVSVVAGLAGARADWQGQLVFLVAAAVGVAGVLSRPGAGVTSLLPVFAGALTWLLVLPRLLHERPVDVGGAGRRRFLVGVALAGAGAAALAIGGRVVGRGRRAVEVARAGLRLPLTPGTVPAGAELGVEGVAPWRVPARDFYRIDTALVVPAVDVDRWRLRIHGMVRHELTVTFEDLLDHRLTEAWVTLCCVSNPVGGDLVGNAWWSGVRVAELLARAQPLPGADAVLQTSQDGWTCGTPIGVLTDGRDALLAVGMNGAPLPLEHGFPVRMVVPGLYGFVSATKWLVDLEVTRFDRIEAYWTSRGWAEKAPVRTQSRIDVPRDGGQVAAGRVQVAGVAWAQHTGIAAVEVQVDGGPWRPMTLGRVPSADTWVQWAGTIEVGSGRHAMAVRATDRSGEPQTAVRRDVVPDGATGWHVVEFTAG